MTITGIDSTAQSADGKPSRRGGLADAGDLDAELRALETDVSTTPISVIPAAEPEAEQALRPRFWRSLTWHDALAILSFVAVSLFVTAPVWLNLDHELRDDPQDQAFFEWMLAHGARVLTDGVYPFF